MSLMASAQRADPGPMETIATWALPLATGTQNPTRRRTPERAKVAPLSGAVGCPWRRMTWATRGSHTAPERPARAEGDHPRNRALVNVRRWDRNAMQDTVDKRPSERGGVVG